MTIPASCLLLSDDSDLAARLARAWTDSFGLRVVGSRAEQIRWQERTGPHVLLLDLRHAEAALLISEATPEERAACIALGVLGSDPFLAACAAGVFAVVPLDVSSAELLLHLRRAAERLDLYSEVCRLRQPVTFAALDQTPAAAATGMDIGPLQQFARASRHAQDAGKLLEQVVEGIAASGQLVRVGVFARRRDEPFFRLQAGLRCLDATDTLTFDADAPLVRWLERHAYLVARVRLAHVAEADERLLLLRALDAFGAEAIIPMLGQRGLLGWIFVGHRTTGLPFAARDLVDLSGMAEHVATLFDNAVLYEELALQRTLAANLVAAMPVGIVAVSGDGTVCECNLAAATILERSAGDLLNRPVEDIGSRLADIAEVRRLNSIIEQIHAFAHPPPVEFRPVPVERLVSAARQAALRLASAEGVIIEQTVAPNLPPLLADENALAQALAHVLANACEALHGRAASRVAIDARCGGADGDAGLIFTISDNGPGVPDDLRDKLFSPFSTTKPRGLGLGLPIARRTVVDHGGRLDIASFAQGTTVTITIPFDGRRNSNV